MKQSIIAVSSLVAATQAVAPVALLHGLSGSCPMTGWTDMISEAIDNQAVVKCVEVGDGKITSEFERMKW